MGTEPEPFTPFRPVDPETFAGHPMPPSLPDGLRIELGRARLLEGTEAEFDSWMAMLHERYVECVATLPAELSAFESIFTHEEADGSRWMYHLIVYGADSPGLDTSNPVDAEHEAFAQRTKERGWEELTPRFVLAPDHIMESIARWGRTGKP